MTTPPQTAPSPSSRAPRPAAIAVAAVGGTAAAAGLWLLPAVHTRWWLPVGVAVGICAHVMLARAAKGILSSAVPLASGSPDVGGYARVVYGTPGRATLEVVGLAVASGLLFGLAWTLGNGWLLWAGLLVLAGTLALDLRRWERVTVSAEDVWFQRGFGQKVHQVAIDNIRDVSISERDDHGFTLRHFTRNRVARINLRMADKRVVALPKTDALTALDGVEAVANHIRTRQQMSGEAASRRPGAARAAPDAAPPVRPASTPDDKAMRRELRRLRAAAAADARAGADDARSPPSDAP